MYFKSLPKRVVNVQIAEIYSLSVLKRNGNPFLGEGAGLSKLFSHLHTHLFSINNFKCSSRLAISIHRFP